GTVVVSSVRALMSPLMAPGRFGDLSRTIRANERLRPDDLVATLLGLGYTNEALVEDPGTFSRRGGIVDVYPVDAALPLRIEFFGDEVDSIRQFDPTTQRSRQIVSELHLAPSREVPLPDASAVAAIQAIDVSSLSEASLAQWTRDLERLADGVTFDGLEFYAPYLAENGSLDYLANDGLVVVDEPNAVVGAANELATQVEELRTELIGRGELPAGFRTAFWDWPALEHQASRRVRLALSWQEGEAERLSPGATSVGRLGEFRAVPSYAGQLHAALDDVARWRQDRVTTLLVSQQSSRLAELLAEQGTP